MPTDPPASDPLRVRLSWPDDNPVYPPERSVAEEPEAGVDPEIESPAERADDIEPTRFWDAAPDEADVRAEAEPEQDLPWPSASEPPAASQAQRDDGDRDDESDGGGERFFSRLFSRETSASRERTPPRPTDFSRRERKPEPWPATPPAASSARRVDPPLLSSPPPPVERAARALDAPAADPTGLGMEEPPEEGSVLFTVAAKLEGLRAAMGTMALRLDNMVRREEEFREFTSSRLAEYAEQIAASVGTASAEVEERTRAQDRTLNELTTGNTSITRSLEGLASAVQALTTQMSELVERVERVESGRDELQTSAERQIAELTMLQSTLLRSTERQTVEIEAVRAEVLAAAERTDARQEALAQEVGQLAEDMAAQLGDFAGLIAEQHDQVGAVADEVRALRRRMTVRTAAAAAPAAATGRKARSARRAEPEEELPPPRPSTRRRRAE